MTERFFKRFGTKIIVFLYGAFYLIAFHLLEKRGMYRIHVIHTDLDYSIPFCEYFIVPYLLWFLFMFLTVFWFMFKNPNRKEYRQLIISLIFGMTVFLAISWLFPNGHLLRPNRFPRDNIFTDIVRMLYKSDTSTNILPSIHVYNSIAACIAIVRSKELRKYQKLRMGTVILTVSIVMATLFLKQHSVVDVILAFVLNFAVYVVIYVLDDHKVYVKKSLAASPTNL